MTEARAFITGCGAVSPLGCGVPAFWQGLLDGRSAIAPIRSFDTTGLTNTLAGEVPDFVPGDHLSRDEVARLDRISQYALAAAREALREAALDLAQVDRSRAGVIAATTLGGIPLGERTCAAVTTARRSMRASSCTSVCRDGDAPGADPRRARAGRRPLDRLRIGNAGCRIGAGAGIGAARVTCSSSAAPRRSATSSSRASTACARPAQAVAVRCTARQVGGRRKARRCW
jgi:hypothetical protein